MPPHDPHMGKYVALLKDRDEDCDYCRINNNSNSFSKQMMMQFMGGSPAHSMSMMLPMLQM